MRSIQADVCVLECCPSSSSFCDPDTRKQNVIVFAVLAGMASSWEQMYRATVRIVAFPAAAGAVHRGSFTLVPDEMD